ncbi:MAG: hypothetical protein WD097_05475 [Balneolales bacterium]
MLSPTHILQKLRSRLHPGHQQVIPRPRARHIKQMPLGVVHLLQIGIVGDRFNPFLMRDDLVVTGHMPANKGNDYCPGKVYGLGMLLKFRIPGNRNGDFLL